MLEASGRRGCLEAASRWTIVLLFLILPMGNVSKAADALRPVSTLPDLSGIAWISEDMFLAVHDAKSSDKDSFRISLLKLPKARDGLLWMPLEVRFPGGASNDLESVSRIPDALGSSGVHRMLLAESSGGQQGKGGYRRIFLAELSSDRIEIADVIDWPVETRNIEATAVARAGGQLVFIYAERAHGEGSTRLHFADLSLAPLRIGAFQTSEPFSSSGFTGPNARPITAMDVDSSGELYIASSEDPQDDNGPFRSAVYRIGKVAREQGKVRLVLYSSPVKLAALDGFKVEGIAVRELSGKPLELFVGSDDENYGSTLRQIQLTAGR